MSYRFFGARSFGIYKQPSNTTQRLTMNTLQTLRKLPLRLALNLRRHQTTSATESNIVYTTNLSFINESFPPTIPTYRVLNTTNTEASDSQISNDEVVKMYRKMVSLNVMDTVLYESQRQGRISFYMTNYGEEACQIGSAAALDFKDLIYAQYRESGILMWRGFSFEDYVNQCYGNVADNNKGRQMPVHYGSKELNYATISSPLTTQLPQAVGAAYGLKLLGKDLCIACYFGEGAASEGDAHAALNFAATLKCPVVFFCRNNGYAISTPSHQQYNGDGIAAKGPAYGIQTLRVDGNDIFAVYNATKFARDFAVKNKKPVLIEAMTYRIGHHSTSDDSTAYRSDKEIKEHLKVSPIVRLKTYLVEKKLWGEDMENELVKKSKKEVIEAMTKAEKREKPHWRELFTDVYKEMPGNLRKQMGMLERHLEKYGDKYAGVGK